MASVVNSQSYPPCLGSSGTDNRQRSPFRSLDTEIYLYRDIECTEKERIRVAQQNLKIYEKSTISSRARSRKALRKLEAAIERETQGDIEKNIPALNWTLAFAKCCQSDKQSIADYISEQKELFLLEYAVKTKQSTISKMEKFAEREEKRVKIAETKLEEDTVAFEEFLKENDNSSVEALKLATQEAKAKMEVTADMKSAMSELFSLKSEIAYSEDLLKCYLSYEAFLLSVSPKAWQDKQMEKKKQKQERQKKAAQYLLSFPVSEKPKANMSSSFVLRHKLNKWAHSKGKQPGKKTLGGKSVSVNLPEQERRKSLVDQGGDYRFFRKPSRFALGKRSSLVGRKRSVPSCPSERSFSSEDEYSLDDIDSDEEPEIYFKQPQELLQIFTELEEQNLSLFQNIQEISGMLEDNQYKEHIITQQKEQIIKNLINEKEALIAGSIKEEEKSIALELKANVFTSGEYNPADMDKILDTLNKKVSEVYNVCPGADEMASLTTFQMLKRIEYRVSELCEMLETLPNEYLDVIEAIEKLRVKERRQRVREERLNDLRRVQEERLKAALARAIAAPKKKVGRKLVYRSQPTETKQSDEHAVDLTKRSEDDYYFT